jgi:hypothetical protein
MSAMNSIPENPPHRTRLFRFGVPLLLVAGSVVFMVALSEAVSAVLIRFTCDKIEQLRPNLAVPDPRVGTTAPPNAAISDTYLRNGKPLYSVTYHTNAQGRRVAPIDAPLERGKFAAFFGCSITFGAGLEDEGTLPACFGRAAPEYMPYNFAYIGYGTQQLYCLMQQPLEKEISQSQGVAVYVYFDNHVMRTIGAMRQVNGWARDYPCFELPEGADAPVCRGTFASAHPWRCKLYGLLEYSQTLKYTGANLPLFPSANHCRLTAVLIRDSMNLFKAKFPNSQFLVLVHPASKPQPEHFAWMQPWLDEYKVPYFFYGEDLVKQVPPEKQTVDGGHPSALANEYTARALASWLQNHKQEP